MSNENQHWVPKFLVKNFADTDGRVFCLNMQTDEITKTPPKHVASDAGFNDFVVNGTPVSFEDHLEKIETAAAPILKQIILSRSVAALASAQRNRIADFIAAQSFRTEAFYKGLELQSREEFGSIFLELWRSGFLLSAEIARRKWVIMTIEHDDVFYLGDHPLVLQHTENPGDGGELGFDIEGVEALVPLTPNCALYMPCASTSHTIISGYESAVAAPETLRLARAKKLETLVDEAEFSKVAQRVIKNSTALYQSLTQGVAFVAAPDNVENLNYLQCLWAHTAIYSNRRDFAFARKVFRENPQYRNLVKVRLATFGKPVTGTT